MRVIAFISQGTSITLDPVVNVSAATPFTVSGTLSGFANLQTLSFVDDETLAPVSGFAGAPSTTTSISLSWNAEFEAPLQSIPASSVTLTRFSFTHPGLSAGSHTIWVTNGTLTTSTAFIIGNPGRDVALQAYSPTDFWNIGIGSGAQWTASSEAQTTRMNGLLGQINSTGNFNQPFYIGEATDPVVTLSTSDTIFPCNPQNIHVPVGATPAGPIPGDQHMSFYDRTQPGKLFTAYFCTVNNAGANGGVTLSTTTITAGYMSVYDATGSGVYPIGLTSFPPVNGGNVGYYNYAAGTIRDWEIAAGSIKHALRYSLGTDAVASPGNYFTVNIPWPDYVEDYCGPPTALTGCAQQEYTGTILYGKTIGIPASVNLSTLGLSAGGLVLATCLQTYGAVIRDTTAPGLLVLYTENLSASSQNIVNTQMLPDFRNKIMPLLRIMTNQSADGLSNVNGGGVYPTALDPFEAAQGATATTTSGFLIDATGDRWSFTAAGRVHHTGADDLNTSSANMVLYWAHTPYYRNTSGTFFRFNGGTSWTQVADPR